MSKGRWLTDKERAIAAHLYEIGYGWRDVGKLMMRDWSGLARRVGGSRNQSEANIQWRNRRA